MKILSGNLKKYLILLPFCFLSIFYLFRVPFGQTPDEPAHLDYIINISRYGYFPDYYSCAIAHHPPLYYILMSFPYLIFNSTLVLRVFSILFSIINLLIIEKIITLLPLEEYKKYNLPVAVMGFCSLVPMYSFMSIAVNNDLFACLLGSLLIYFTLLSLEIKFSRNIFGFWAIVIFSAIFTKIILWPVAFISGAVIYLNQKNSRKKCTFLFLVILIGLFLWFIRNIILYGKWDILSWNKLREVEYFLTENKLILTNTKEWLLTVFHSFWGIFGWFSIYLPLPAYQFLRRMTVLLFIPFIYFIYRNLKKENKSQRLSVIIFISFFIIISMAIIRDNLNFFHPQGRYFFVVISVIGFYYIIGLLQIFLLLNKMIKKHYVCIFYYLIFIPMIYLNIISAMAINKYFNK